MTPDTAFQVLFWTGLVVGYALIVFVGIGIYRDFKKWH